MNFLVGSNSSSVALLRFDPSAKTISVIKDNASLAKAPSWIEKSRSSALAGKVVYAVSEEAGLALSLEVEQTSGDVSISSSVGTFGNPAHIHAMKDGSGVVATNYMGGSALFIPIDQSTGKLAPSNNAAISSALSPITPVALSSLVASSHLLKFTSPYGSAGGPNKERQEASHPHECIEGADGLLFVPDLGSDRVWMLRRGEGESLREVGYLQLPDGAGPRHAAVTEDNKYLYVLSELSHSIFIFAVPTGESAVAAHALNESNPTLIVPPAVPASLRPSMTAGELIFNPQSQRTLYASNRGQVTPDGEADGDDKVRGDAIAVVSLTASGDQVENMQLMQTQANFIRGMAASPDGKYLGLIGQKDGVVEVYECKGERGEQLELVARTTTQIDAGTDVVWL